MRFRASRIRILQGRAREFEPSSVREAGALLRGRASVLRGQCATARQIIDEKLLKCSVMVQLDSHG